MICGSLFLHRTNGFGRMVPIYVINSGSITAKETLEFQEDVMDLSVGWIPKKETLCGCLVALGSEGLIHGSSWTISGDIAKKKVGFGSLGIPLKRMEFMKAMSLILVGDS